MHLNQRFDAVVANPPFPANWSASELHLNSRRRFADYGKLAPKTKADFAFVLHMIHQLNETGIASGRCSRHFIPWLRQ